MAPRRLIQPTIWSALRGVLSFGPTPSQQMFAEARNKLAEIETRIETIEEGAEEEAEEPATEDSEGDEQWTLPQE